MQAQQRQLAVKLIRLHVVANSDSPLDQAIKLRVRDAVLEAAKTVMQGADDPEQALLEHLDILETAAEETSRRLNRSLNRCLNRTANRDEPVALTYESERFPTREYETFSLPAGVYRTLRVTIGEGKGHNWWCVVFPSICTAASLDELESAAVSGGFTEGEIRLITGADEGYTLKFKTLEWMQKLKAFLFGS